MDPLKGLLLDPLKGLLIDPLQGHLKDPLEGLLIDIPLNPKLSCEKPTAHCLGEQPPGRNGEGLLQVFRGVPAAVEFRGL